jgi:hypothetical protein
MAHFRAIARIARRQQLPVVACARPLEPDTIRDENTMRLLTAPLSALLFSVAAAHADTWEFNGTFYDFSIYSGTIYEDTEGVIAGSFWWGDQALTEQVAQFAVLNNVAGYNSPDYWSPVAPENMAPLVAWNSYYSPFVPTILMTSGYFYRPDHNPPLVDFRTNASWLSEYFDYYLVATPAAVSVPEIDGRSLPLLAFVLGLAVRSGRHMPQI